LYVTCWTPMPGPDQTPFCTIQATSSLVISPSQLQVFSSSLSLLRTCTDQLQYISLPLSQPPTPGFAWLVATRRRDSLLPSDPPPCFKSSSSLVSLLGRGRLAGS
jgi:hypothetical protein